MPHILLKQLQNQPIFPTMERYHIFKLGLAITFYAAYCIRPMLVYSLQADIDLENNKNTSSSQYDYFQYFQGVEGRPGLDYPVFSYIPRTTFNCRGIESGYYADLETNCQVFHICEEGKKISFLCPNGTIFQQSELICEWWNKVNCTNSPSLYEESAERLQNDIARRKSLRKVHNGQENEHGAVMRTEERSSVRATKNGKEYPVSRPQGQRIKVKVNRVPDNNDIEQQIETEESNNRHLAKAQNLLKQERHPNHNYDAEEVSKISSRNDKTSSGQIKKDIDKQTGNYFNGDYESNRHSKKVDLGEHNSFTNYDVRKSGGQRTTLKEYHVEFGSTSAGVDATTKIYTAPPFVGSTAQKTTTNSANSYKNNEFSSGSKQFGATGFTVASTEASVSNPNIQESYQVEQRLSSGARLVPEVQNTPSLSKSPTINVELDNEDNTYNTEEASNRKSSTQDRKSDRGSVRYSVSSNFFDSQKIKPITNTQNSLVTSAPRQSFSSKTLDHKDLDLKTENYDLTFPKHQSDQGNFQITAKAVNKSTKSEFNQDLYPEYLQKATQSPPTAVSYILEKGPKLLGQTQKLKLEHKITTSPSVENGSFKTVDSDESQVPQESSSFVKSSFNSISDNSFKTSARPYPNHRSTYSDVKELGVLDTPKIPSISSITPHLVTTQPINNGKPFLGSRVGSSVIPKLTTLSKYTYLPTTSTPDLDKTEIVFGILRHSSTTEAPPFGPPEIFNVGYTDKPLPSVETTTVVTNPVPTETFNIGNTDNTVQPNVVPLFGTTTIQPLEIYVPEEGSLNVGQGEVKVSMTQLPEPVSEPLFIKQNVPLLYSGSRSSSSTERAIDHSTVYGSYASTSDKLADSSPLVSSTSSPGNSATVYGTYSSGSPSSTTQRTSQEVSQGVPVRFEKGSDKISVQLSKSFGGSRTSKQLALLKLQQATTPVGTQNGFSVTKYNNDISSAQSKTQRPRPFAKSLNIEGRFREDGISQGLNSVTPAFPAYQISSARPFGLSTATKSTPFSTTLATPLNSIYENVDNMISVLQEIANANRNDEPTESRPGLVIPPSVGPETLHSLAQYFANEMQVADRDNKTLEPETKEKLTTLLTQMTVHGYNNLFNVGSTSTAIPSTSTIYTSTEATTIATAVRVGESEENEVIGQEGLGDPTAVPELRQLARNFSMALSSYLNDPDNFRKDLEGLRPTEPPPLANEPVDSAEAGTADDELLNFSDADIKPTTPSYPSPTWGYILASKSGKPTDDDVKNSLNPDLHTADSQSFIPKYNNIQTDDKQKSYTDLPPNHWTSSPQATKLWQKALSVNPAIVNKHFEATSSGLPSAEEETTEAELYSQDQVFPNLNPPRSEISYDLRELPPLTLNSTQVRGILIDFMNHSKTDHHSRLNRILKKLNTSEDEFLNRMKEIEENPLTKRLILLLISECGANITSDLDIKERTGIDGVDHRDQGSSSGEILKTSASGNGVGSRSANGLPVSNSFLKLVDPHLREEDEDARALQLLNSLYTIASRFGK